MKSLLAIVCALSLSMVKGQDPIYTNSVQLPVLSNPSFTAIETCTKVWVASRIQWPGLGKGYQTTIASLELGKFRKQFGIGFTLIQDQAGEGGLRNQLAHATLSKGFDLDHYTQLRFGLSMGMAQTSVNWNELVFPDMLDARRGLVNQTMQTFAPPQNYFHANFGTSLVYKNWYVGFTAFNLNKPVNGLLNTNELARLPRHYAVQSGFSHASFVQGKRVIWRPSLNLDLQNKFFTASVGTSLTFDQITVGGWYNYPGTFSAMFAWKSDMVSFSYAYDQSVTHSLTTTWGSHNLIISAQFGCSEKRKIKFLDCPIFY